MPSIRETHLEKHLSDEELEYLFQSSPDTKHRERFQMLWLVQHKQIPAIFAAQMVGRAKSWAHYWITIYNKEGPEGVTKKRLRNPNIGNPKLSKQLKQTLFKLFEHPFPKFYGGGAWSGPKVKIYLQKKCKITIHRRTGWALLRESGMTLQTCRPCHVDSSKELKDTFKKNSP